MTEIIDQHNFDNKVRGPLTAGPIVLIILTCLTLVIGIINSIVNAFKYETDADMEADFMTQIDQAQGAPDWVLDGMMNMFESIIQNQSWMMISGILATALGVVFVILFLARYQVAFTVYLAYSVVSLIPFFLMGNNFIMYIYAGVVLLFTLLFVWLYSRQRKFLYK